MQPTLFEIETATPQPGEIAFTVFGLAQPAGSKSSFVPLDRHTGEPFRKNGRVIVNTVDANPKVKGWQTEVKDAARAAYNGERLSGPVELIVRIYRPRLKAHFRANGAIKPSAPRWCWVNPDCTKLLRGIEDAITQAGNIWTDDAQVSRQLASKEYADLARVEIIVRSLEAT